MNESWKKHQMRIIYGLVFLILGTILFCISLSIFHFVENNAKRIGLEYCTSAILSVNKIKSRSHQAGFYFCAVIIHFAQTYFERKLDE